MKKILLFVFVGVLFFSCKKEKQYDPDEHITYTHWYKTMSRSADTLFSVYIPNAFTPNGDGINDVFFPRGRFTGNYFSLKIFDRNGEVLFYTADQNFYPGWTGSKTSHYGGMIGVYLYQLKLNDNAGSDYEYNGSVTMIR
jgi:gliding motility-associated-like protein